MSTTTTTRPKPSDYNGAGDDLENALTSIEGVADVLDVINDANPKDNAVPYLTNQLHDYCGVALDAFRRIYGLDQYREERPAESGAITEEQLKEIVEEGGRAFRTALKDFKRERADADLFALIAEYRRQEREVNTPKGRSDGRSEEEIDQLSDELRAVRDKIDKVRPVTLRGVLAVLDLGECIYDPDWWPDEAIVSLRKIVEHGDAS
jgi:hypothetical protein